MSQLIKYLHIDSRNRTSGTSNQFSIPIQPAVNSVKSAKLISMAMPVSNYNVSASNNQLPFTDGTTNYVGIVTPGVYTSLNLPAAIQSAMTGVWVGGTVMVTIDPITYKVTITTSVNISYQFGSYTAFTIAYLLGFNNTNTSLSTTATGQNSINLSIPPCIFMNISQFPIMTRSSNGFNGTFPIYITMISGQVNFLFEHTHVTLETSQTMSSFNKFDISLWDPNSLQLYDLQNEDWCFTLELTY